MLTHRNFVSNCEQLGRTNRGCAKRSDVLLLVLPLFHIYVMNCAMNTYRRVGATSVIVRRFDPLLVLEHTEASLQYLPWRTADVHRLGEHAQRSVNMIFAPCARPFQAQRRSPP